MSLENAVYWCMRAAAQGHIEAQLYFGLMNLCGIGVHEDEEMALKWKNWHEARFEQDGDCKGVFQEVLNRFLMHLHRLYTGQLNKGSPDKTENHEIQVTNKYDWDVNGANRIALRISKSSMCILKKRKKSLKMMTHIPTICPAKNGKLTITIFSDIVLLTPIIRFV